ncbi:CAP domain-containing protein, partial [Actinoplanes sp. NPDC051633]|uniref:CAP domain-containing protein n=1 Tax=Actinoplanes sp. NPDC051633 TaxID=3155670 RepID=UPI00344297F8
ATNTYEGEAATNALVGGARAVSCRRCSGGSRVTGLGGAGTLTVTGVVAEQAGTARLAISYVAATTRTAQLTVNDAGPAQTTFPGTRSGTRPGTVTVDVTLAAGTNTIGFANPEGAAPDIDRIVVTTTPVPSEPTPSEPTPSEPPAGEHEAFEVEVVSLVNAERATAGCAAVTREDRLTAAARGHSADMAARGYFSHTTPEGVEFATRITNAGYVWRTAGENIAKGYRTPEQVMTGWMNSAGHKANILNCAFRDLGVGVAAAPDGTLLWTQDFATAR